MKRNGRIRPATIPSVEKGEAFFSYFIRFIRKQSGFTQTQIAGWTGYSPSYISTVENGHAYRNIMKTHRIIYAIGADPATLHECTARLLRISAQDRPSRG